MQLRREGLQLILQLANTILLLGILTALVIGRMRIWTGADAAQTMFSSPVPTTQAAENAFRGEEIRHSILVRDPTMDYQPYGLPTNGIMWRQALSVFIQNDAPIPVCIAKPPPLGIPGAEQLPWKC